MAKWKLPEGRQPLTTVESADLVLRMHDKLAAGFSAGDRIAQLEAENKRLNEQMDAIEEMGTESLNALPDCLMRLAPALVENDELKAKLAKAVETLEWQADAIHNSITVNMKHNHRILLDGIYHEGPLVDWVHKILTGFETINRNTLAELKGDTE